MPEQFGSILTTSHSKHAVISKVNPATKNLFLLSQSVPIRSYHSHPYGEYGYKAAMPSHSDIKDRDRIDRRAGKNVEHFINIILLNNSIGTYNFSRQ